MLLTRIRHTLQRSVTWIRKASLAFFRSKFLGTIVKSIGITIFVYYAIIGFSEGSFVAGGLATCMALFFVLWSLVDLLFPRVLFLCFFGHWVPITMKGKTKQHLQLAVTERLEQMDHSILQLEREMRAKRKIAQFAITNNLPDVKDQYSRQWQEMADTIQTQEVLVNTAAHSAVVLGFTVKRLGLEKAQTADKGSQS